MASLESAPRQNDGLGPASEKHDHLEPAPEKHDHLEPAPTLKKNDGRRLHKRSSRLHRLPSSQMPSRLRLGADAQDDVTDPKRGNKEPAAYMNQSIFSMIAAAAGSTQPDFNARFDESSDSDDATIEEEDEPCPRHPASASSTRHTPSAVIPSPVTPPGVVTASPAAPDTPSRRPAGHQAPHVASRPSARQDKGKGKGREDGIDRVARQSASPSSDSTSKSSSRSNPREAPVLSRILTAEAQFQELAEPGDPSASSTGPTAARTGGEASPRSLLAARLMDIFGFDEPEEVVAEYPCWLLQSVLLQGYLYITHRHICFYAYLSRKTNTVAKTGYLLKRGRTTAKYKKSWFSLKGDVLSYFTDPSNLYFPSGHIDLRYGTAAALAGDKGHPTDAADFSVITDHRTYHLRAESAAAAREWVRAIQKTIFRSHNDGDSVKISLALENVIDFEESPVVEFADTVKIRAMESDDSYAVDEYFFSFFSYGKDALRIFGNLLTEAPPRSADEGPPSPGRAAGGPPSLRSPPRPAQKDDGRSALRNLLTQREGRLSSKASGDVSHGRSPSRSSSDVVRDGRRASGDRGRRSGSTSRREVDRPTRTAHSPLTKHQASDDSYVQSLDKDTDSSTGPLSPRLEAQMSASQILTRSDVFHGPAVHRMETLASVSTEPTRKSSGTVPSSSPHRDTASPLPVRTAGDPARRHLSNRRATSTDEPALLDFDAGGKFSSGSPTLQDLVKAGAYPLQRAGAFADYLKHRSSSMKKLLATESMSYLEKVSGMWAGNRKHYGDNEGVVPNDRGTDPEDEDANVGHGDRFRAHFALPASEKLQATYYGYIHRVLPLFGKIYIGTHKFCFRSLLPGTRTKLVLPLQDIENVDKEKGFRFGYHGLVLVIRGHEELFFEFSSAEHRDDCTVTLLHSLESVRYLAEVGDLVPPGEDPADAAREEHRMLEEVRRRHGDDERLVVPETSETIYSHDESLPPLFGELAASVTQMKPAASLRITCLTIGSRGDVQPYIALCKGLLAEGHQPRIATHAEFGPWVERHGIEFRPVDGDPAELMRICVENGMFTYSFLREASSKFRSWIDELLVSAWHACQDSDVLIESPSAMAGIHIAEALRIPYFRAFTMPWTRTRAYPHAFAVPEHKIGGAYNYYSYVMFDNVFWKAISGQVNRWRKKDLGLRSTNLDKMQPNKVPFLYNFSPHVVAPPLDYSDWVRVTGYWFLNEAQDWSPPAELVAFIRRARDDGKKLVYIGFGSIVVSDPAALTKTVVDSVLKADVRCILSKGWSDRLGDPAAVKTEVPLPREILAIKSAPHDWLFTQIDAAVHHGGAGTTGASLRAGLPTVVKPFFGDQFFFGSRVEDLGVGICLKKVNVSLFSRALWEVTYSERMIVRARLLGEQIRQEDGVKTAIQAIYRDLDYAKSLVQGRTTTARGLGLGLVAGELDEGDEVEESWTFVGDEVDAELHSHLHSLEAAARG